MVRGGYLARKSGSGKATRSHVMVTKGRRWPTTIYTDTKSLYTITMILFAQNFVAFQEQVVQDTIESNVTFIGLKYYTAEVNKARNIAVQR